MNTNSSLGRRAADARERILAAARVLMTDDDAPLSDAEIQEISDVEETLASYQYLACIDLRAIRERVITQRTDDHE